MKLNLTLNVTQYTRKHMRTHTHTRFLLSLSLSLSISMRCNDSDPLVLSQ